MRIKNLIYNSLFMGVLFGESVSKSNKFILLAILISVITAILSTEIAIEAMAGYYIEIIEGVIAVIFLVEYILRVWSVGINPEYRGVLGRFRYIFSFHAVIDFFALVITFATLLSTEALALRIFRALLLFRVLRVTRYGRSFELLKLAFKNQAPELIITFAMAFGILFISATALYLVEGVAQPESFGSIPRSLWWSVITLTTVGYGDVYPITVLGKVLTSVLAFIGIALVALPAGILASGLTEAHQEIKNKER
jgi:voltage-gated potassium channel